MCHKIYLHCHQTAVKKNLFHHENLLTGARKFCRMIPFSPFYCQKDKPLNYVPSNHDQHNVVKTRPNIINPTKQVKEQCFRGVDEVIGQPNKHYRDIHVIN